VKYRFVVLCVALVVVLQPSFVLASDIQEYRAKAAKHYQEENFKKAYKIYFKLAKIGDFYSQNKLSQMYIDGKGREVDLNEAYAWSVLAAESGVDGIVEKSDRLLQRTDDQASARKRAEKLKHKYGKDALQAKAEKKERRKYNHQSGGCTGSKLGCSIG